MYSSGVLSWSRVTVLLFRVLMVVFIDSIVAPRPARVYMCGCAGWLVGWLVLVTARFGVCLFVSARGLSVCERPRGVVACSVLCGRAVDVGAPLPLVFAWCVPRERPCLREVCGRVGDMEVIALL